MNNENTLPVGIKPSLSLADYNHEIKQSLKIGEQFTNLLTTVLETTNTADLFNAIKQLLQIELQSRQIKFLHQYTNNDWCLLFMARFLELKDINGFSLASAKDHEELGMFLIGTGTKIRYQFTDSTINGTYFTDIETNKKLFYLNLKDQKLIFNSQDIVDLFIVQEHTKINPKECELAMDVLLSFAQVLEELSFEIDYSILETKNDYSFSTTTEDLPSQILDKLFIASAQANVLMQPVENGYGAQLILSDELNLKFLRSGDEHMLNGFWHFEVIDEQQKASFFSVLTSYPFLQRWYLENRKLLDVKSLKKEKYVDNSTLKVQVLMPTSED